MATSPNYSWAEPDNSSLVKNGASDIRTLGDAIDTSVWNVGYGQAGKNKIINGDFEVWQRGTSFTAYNAYWADRWTSTGDRTSPSFTRQTFTPATAPVAGYEGEYYARWVPGSGGTFSNMQQRIEDVRTFAGQTVTLSFYAKTDVAQTLSLFYGQNFGSGGSANVDAAISPSASLTTSWTRFTATFAIPSISGKTIGTGSFLQIVLNGAVNKTIDVWGLQLEAGSVATAFQTATGTIQGELAACERYCQAYNPATAYSFYGIGYYNTTTLCYIALKTKTTMRTSPTATFSAAALFIMTSVGTGRAASAINVDAATPDFVGIYFTTSAATAGNGANVQSNNSLSSQILLSAEL